MYLIKWDVYDFSMLDISVHFPKSIGQCTASHIKREFERLLEIYIFEIEKREDGKWIFHTYTNLTTAAKNAKKIKDMKIVRGCIYEYYKKIYNNYDIKKIERYVGLYIMQIWLTLPENQFSCPGLHNKNMPKLVQDLYNILNYLLLKKRKHKEVIMILGELKKLLRKCRLKYKVSSGYYEIINYSCKRIINNNNYRNKDINERIFYLLNI
jgi:hypothetical protein